MRLIIFTGLIIILVACANHSNSAKETTQKPDKISILNSSFTSTIGIYFLEGDSITTQSLQQASQKFIPDFQQVKSFERIDSTKDVFYLRSVKSLQGVLTPPDTTYLKQAGKNISLQEAQKLQKCKEMFTLTFMGNHQHIFKKQYNISCLVKQLVKGKRAILADFSTLEYFNETSWNKYRVENFTGTPKDITGQITIQIYPVGTFCRAVTLGMDKFCLPDISVKGFFCKKNASFLRIFQSIVQTLGETSHLDADSSLQLNLFEIKNARVKRMVQPRIKTAQGSAKVRLKSVLPEKGDKKNQQFTLVFNNPRYFSEQSEQTALITKLFGAQKDIVYTKRSAKVMEASKKARQAFPKLKKIFNEGLPEGHSLMLKAPFKTDDGGVEWIWVKITEWKNQLAKGQLWTTPFRISRLKAGMDVSVNPALAFDYILQKSDGSFEGNKTEKIIRENNER
jgi:hypothetical protein